jgi:hypothetical protein
VDVDKQRARVVLLKVVVGPELHGRQWSTVSSHGGSRRQGKRLPGGISRQLGLVVGGNRRGVGGDPSGRLNGGRGGSGGGARRGTELAAESKKQGQGGVEVEEAKRERGSRPRAHFIGVRGGGDGEHGGSDRGWKMAVVAPRSGRRACSKRWWFGHCGLQVGPAQFN